MKEKTLDLDFDRERNTKVNNCDINELLMCIHAWHEMDNPGHHHMVLFSDGSGYMKYAINTPKMCKIPLVDRPEIISFICLKDFISKTYEEMKY